MGKKQHSKDRLFLTRSEWNAEWGGYKAGKDVKQAELPYYCCALSLQPFTHPYCTKDGYIFDLTCVKNTFIIYLVTHLFISIHSSRIKVRGYDIFL